MHPAQPVHEAEQFELRRVVAYQGQVVVPRLREQRAVEGRFADQRAMFFVLDAPAAELLAERLAAHEARLAELGHPPLQFLRRPQRNSTACSSVSVPSTYRSSSLN
jgi:hypothetical protein